jgi:type IV pilus assembly protein PilA
MLNKLRVRTQSESGFTLVELLVVMLIIGLLAAIAIPAFFNQRDKAKDSNAKEGVRTAQTAMETCATDNGGSYANCTTVVKLTDIEPTLADYGANLTIEGTPTATSYTVQVKSTGADGNLFQITRNAGGTIDYKCGTTAGTPPTIPGKAGCPSTGNWDA